MSATAVKQPACDVQSQQSLSPEQLSQWKAAQERASKLKRMKGIAAFNRWTMTVLALLSLPFAFFSIVGFLSCAALISLAVVEFLAKQKLDRFEPVAAQLLGWNQVALLVVIYCTFSIFQGMYQEGEALRTLSAPEYRDALGLSEQDLSDLKWLYKSLIAVTYASIAGLSIVFQGLNAWYYFARRRQIQAYKDQTPAWIHQLQQ